MPVTLFARELHINSDVVHDAKARELSTCLLPGDARSVESAEERALAARQMLTRLPLASVSGVGHVRPTTAASMDGDGSAVKTSEVEAEPAGAGSKAEARRLRKEVAAWRDAATELMGREGKVRKGREREQGALRRAESEVHGAKTKVINWSGNGIIDGRDTVDGRDTKRHRETERDWETERETHRERHGERETVRDRDRETEKERERYTQRKEREREKDRDTRYAKQTERL